MKKKSCMKEILEDIRLIDIDHNGFVTNCELNLIFQNHYEKELDGKSLIKILRPFSSVQNRVLIDYRRFFRFINEKLHEDQVAVTHEDIERVKEIKSNWEKQSE